MNGNYIRKLEADDVADALVAEPQRYIEAAAGRRRRVRYRRDGSPSRTGG